MIETSDRLQAATAEATRAVTHYDVTARCHADGRATTAELDAATRVKAAALAELTAAAREAAEAVRRSLLCLATYDADGFADALGPLAREVTVIREQVEAARAELAGLVGDLATQRMKVRDAMRMVDRVTAAVASPAPKRVAKAGAGWVGF